MTSRNVSITYNVDSPPMYLMMAVDPRIDLVYDTIAKWQLTV